MIDISRHIETLLLEHSCVAVPKLGGFVTYEVSARFIEEENLFLPPYRSVGFNPQLQMNDGLLIQTIMMAADASYPEAVGLLSDAVSHIRHELQEKGAYLFEGIGTIFYTLEGNYRFEPCEAGVLTPQFYGLDSFQIPLLAARKEETAESIAPVVTHAVKKKSKTYTFSIKKKVVNYAAAAVVAVATYFAWAVPVSDASHSIANEAAVFSNELFKPLPVTSQTPAPVVLTEAQLTEEMSPTTAELPAPEPKESLPAKTTEENAKTTTAQAGKFTIVLASAITEKNAGDFVRRLKGENFVAEVMKTKKMVRVVYGNYSTEAEAQTALRGLRANPDFKSAWVMAR